MIASITWRRAARAGSATTLALLAGLLAVSARAEPPTRTEVVPFVRFTPGTLRVASPHQQAGSVILHWEGTIAAPMAAQIEAAFLAFASSRRRFVVYLNTGGGSVLEGEKVIAVLQRIKRSHQLDTAVSQGSRCGSMCIPIYLQGKNRFAGRSSSWLFHEVTRPGAHYGSAKRVTESYRRLIDKFWVPAGVSPVWIERMLVETANHDWWQTGNELIADKAGIITHAIENRRPRNLETEAPSASAGPATTTPLAKAFKDAGSPPRAQTEAASPSPAPMAPSEPRKSQ